jgi:hypothetical protein
MCLTESLGRWEVYYSQFKVSNPKEDNFSKVLVKDRECSNLG